MTFEEAWRECEPYTMLGQDRGRLLWDLVQQTRLVPGAVAELGVYKGGSALLLHRAAPERRLHLFDTFRGHPEGPREHDVPGAHPPGRFSDTAASDVLRLFEHAWARGAQRGVPSAMGVTVHVGEFPSGLGLMPLEWSFVHLDADLYWSVYRACNFFWRGLNYGAVVLIDDYGFPDCAGAKQAVDRWITEHPGYHLRVEPTGQAWFRSPGHAGQP